MFKLNVSPLFVNLCVAPALLFAFGLVYLCVGAPMKPMIVHAQKNTLYKNVQGRQTANSTLEHDANPAEANETTPLLSNDVTEPSE